MLPEWRGIISLLGKRLLLNGHLEGHSRRISVGNSEKWTVIDQGSLEPGETWRLWGEGRDSPPEKDKRGLLYSKYLKLRFSTYWLHLMLTTSQHIKKETNRKVPPMQIKMLRWKRLTIAAPEGNLLVRKPNRPLVLSIWGKVAFHLRSRPAGEFYLKLFTFSVTRGR